MMTKDPWGAPKAPESKWKRATRISQGVVDLIIMGTSATFLIVLLLVSHFGR